MDDGLIVGFSGSRYGMTEPQRRGVEVLLDLICPRKARHGLCLGSDAGFDGMCVDRGIWRIGHPPLKREWRAWIDVDELLPEKDYHPRDRDIVDGSHVLIATPRRLSGGGTWYTVNYARVRPIWIILVYPDGVVEESVRLSTGAPDLGVVPSSSSVAQLFTESARVSDATTIAGVVFNTRPPKGKP